MSTTQVLYADRCDRRVRVVTSVASVEDFRNSRAYRLQINIAEAVNVTEHLFLFRRKPLNPYTNTQEDEFIAVAGPADLVDYPVGEPDPGRDLPFFRGATLDVVVASSILGNQVRADVEEEILVLLDALCRLDFLEEAADTWIPSAPEDDSESSSESESTSESE